VGIIVEDRVIKKYCFTIRSITRSIEEKARAEQESGRMEFVLLKAKTGSNKKVN
jgi:hypothetical protein